MSIPEDPHTRIERYLDVLAGGDGTIPANPHTRIERYLDVLAGGDGTKPTEPHTRIERYLDAIIDGTYKREESSDPYNTLVIPDNSSDELILKSLTGASVAWNQLVPDGGGDATVPANHVYYLDQGTATLNKSDSESTIPASDGDLVIDLTLMFGATVANHIYNNEMVAWFETFIENLDKSYNAGELVSVSATAHVIKDIEGVVQHTYTLDSSLELHGLVKLDASRLYYDGDTYEADGTVARKYGAVNLGTLTWYAESGQSNLFYTRDITLRPTGYNIDSICGKYEMQTGSAFPPDKRYLWLNYHTSRDLFIHDSAYSTAAEFKSAMNGVYMVYKLQTPTTATATPFTNLQTVEPGGTASFVGNDIPVGADVVLSVKAG